MPANQQMADYQILYWRDMPAQIRVFGDGRPKSYKLSERFQVAIDKVAMDEGLVNSDEYLEQWVWSDRKSREGSAEEVAAQVIEEIERA